MRTLKLNISGGEIHAFKNYHFRDLGNAIDDIKEKNPKADLDGIRAGFLHGTLSTLERLIGKKDTQKIGMYILK